MLGNRCINDLIIGASVLTGVIYNYAYNIKCDFSLSLSVFFFLQYLVHEQFIRNRLGKPKLLSVKLKWYVAG